MLTIMKKLFLYLGLTLTSLAIVSCHGHRPVKTIETRSGSYFAQIKYDGTVRFSSDSTAIESLSPMSTLRYRSNTGYLQINSNENGLLTYEMQENGKTLLLDQQGKDFIAKTVKEMIVLGAGDNH